MLIAYAPEKKLESGGKLKGIGKKINNGNENQKKSVLSITQAGIKVLGSIYSRNLTSIKKLLFSEHTQHLDSCGGHSLSDNNKGLYVSAPLRPAAPSRLRDGRYANMTRSRGWGYSEARGKYSCLTLTRQQHFL